LRAGTAGKSSLVTFRISELQFSYHSANIGFMLYEVQSDRQCCGTCSGETHKVVRIDTREVVAVERRRDVAEQICAALDERTPYRSWLFSIHRLFDSRIVGHDDSALKEYYSAVFLSRD
jgi:hypothetical protein